MLVYTEKAIVLEEYEATVSSPSVTFQVPAVLQLKKEMSLFKKGVKYDAENTGYGFRSEVAWDSYISAQPTSCQMKRPG